MEEILLREICLQNTSPPTRQNTPVLTHVNVILIREYNTDSGIPSPLFLQPLSLSLSLHFLVLNFLAC